jgi:hypothetical protein
MTISSRLRKIADNIALDLPPIKWQQPNIYELRDEFHEADVVTLWGYYDRDEEHIFNIFKDSLYPLELDPKDLSRKNSWRFTFKDYDALKKQVERYGKNPDTIVAAIRAGKAMPMPVVILSLEGEYLLAGGATRTAIANLAGQKITALVFDAKYAQKYRADKALSLIHDYLKERDATAALKDILDGNPGKGSTSHWLELALEDFTENGGDISELKKLVTKKASRMWQYGASLRPIAYANVPAGWVHKEPHPSFRHGVVTYDRALTPNEIASYELVPFLTREEVEARIEAARADIEENKEEWRGHHKEVVAYIKHFLDEMGPGFYDVTKAVEEVLTVL